MVGMLVVETIAKIRWLHLGQGLPIKAICRQLGLSRKVVRKVLRSGATEFRYEGAEQPQPKRGAWRDELDRLLEENAGRASRERLTLMRVFEVLRGLGYGGGYDTVRRYARNWQRLKSEVSAAAFVPLSSAPGEAYQFDWSHEVVVMAGATMTVKVAHMRLCHSRMLFVRALCGPVRWVPRGACGSLQDLPGTVRRQQILGVGGRGRQACRGARLCRLDRTAPGRARGR